MGGEAVGQYDILQGGLALTSGNYQLTYQVSGLKNGDS
ncbi:hypothetical protein, partial [Pseudomonas aeruginosa]